MSIHQTRPSERLLTNILEMIIIIETYPGRLFRFCSHFISFFPPSTFERKSAPIEGRRSGSRSSSSSSFPRMSWNISPTPRSRILVEIESAPPIFSLVFLFFFLFCSFSIHLLYLHLILFSLWGLSTHKKKKKQMPTTTVHTYTHTLRQGNQRKNKNTNKEKLRESRRRERLLVRKTGSSVTQLPASPPSLVSLPDGFFDSISFFHFLLKFFIVVLVRCSCLSGRKKNIFTIPSENTKGGGRTGEAIMDRRFKVMMQKPSVYIEWLGMEV